jgi:uncharacterized protein (DUF486 family)
MVKKMDVNDMIFLVGDNPFHNISHFSQDRARIRDKKATTPKHATDLIECSLVHGADGFMFSVSNTTLSILSELRKRNSIHRLSLYAIVPYATEYIQLSTQVGGIPNLAKKIIGNIILSKNLKTMLTGSIGFLKSDPVALLKTYLTYEINRIKASAGKRALIDCLILHEVLTDLGIALNFDWLFKSYIQIAKNKGITPGFNTVNSAYLIQKFFDWGIDTSEIALVSPFNKIGFQMSPSKEVCEKALTRLSKPNLIAISVLAAGYLTPTEAIEYLATLPNLRGVAVGVSKEKHAVETFKLLNKILKHNLM